LIHWNNQLRYRFNQLHVVIIVFSINNQLVFISEQSEHHEIIREYSIHLKNYFLSLRMSKILCSHWWTREEKKKVYSNSHLLNLLIWKIFFLKVSCVFWVEEDQLLNLARFLWKYWSGCISHTWFFHVYGFYTVLCLCMTLIAC